MSDDWKLIESLPCESPGETRFKLLTRVLVERGASIYKH